MPEATKIQINLEEINEKKQRLESIAAELKTEFVGIDYVIDELIDDIQIWYLMPAILSRPVIINLWGMTGVGKTDLVRKMVQKLSFQDRFAEVELSHGSESWPGSVTRILENNHINNGQPAIILFDELQRFGTLDPEGKPILDTKFQDFWELLSDGRLAKRDVKDEINEQLQRTLFSHLQRLKRKASGEEEEEPAVGLWQAQQVKKLFNLEGEVTTIADMTEADLLTLLMSLKEKKKIYEPVNHSQTLIIISGNLDEAYTMALDVSEADIDADIFRAYTEKITLVDIKNALSRKFKPEQVARFGNTHLIYRSLKKADFEELIRREIVKIIKKNLEHFGVEVQILPNISQLIYQNGVFPVQGVRPVFSSVMDILEANLSKLLFEALTRKMTTITIDYDFARNKIVGLLDQSHTVEIDFVGKIDSIRQGNRPDNVANVSVHEAGHAVVYGVLFGLAPLQLKSKVASSYAGGFTFPHQIYETMQNMLNKMTVYLAGGLAEDLIFGDIHATTGRISDREETTRLAAGYIRKFGFKADFQAFYENSPMAPMNTDVTDAAIEALVKRQVKMAEVILKEHKEYLIALSKKLMEAGSLTASQVAALSLSFGIEVVIQPETYQYIAPYSTILEEAV